MRFGAIDLIRGRVRPGSMSGTERTTSRCSALGGFSPRSISNCWLLYRQSPARRSLSLSTSELGRGEEVALSLLEFFVIVFYDQRNNQFYNAAIGRA
jgi:hypothetical protein